MPIHPSHPGSSSQNGRVAQRQEAAPSASITRTMQQTRGIAGAMVSPRSGVTMPIHPPHPGSSSQNGRVAQLQEAAPSASITRTMQQTRGTRRLEPPTGTNQRSGAIRGRSVAKRPHRVAPGAIRWLAARHRPEWEVHRRDFQRSDSLAAPVVVTASVSPFHCSPPE